MWRCMHVKKVVQTYRDRGQWAISSELWKGFAGLRGHLETGVVEKKKKDGKLEVLLMQNLNQKHRKTRKKHSTRNGSKSWTLLVRESCYVCSYSVGRVASAVGGYGILEGSERVNRPWRTDYTAPWNWYFGRKGTMWKWICGICMGKNIYDICGICTGYSSRRILCADIIPNLKR